MKLKNKRVLTVAFALMTAGALTACGGKNAGEGTDAGAGAEDVSTGSETGEIAYLKDFQASDYVTLGEYKGIQVEVDDPEVTDEYLDGYISYLLYNDAEVITVTDRSVEVGDTANIDYEGKLDGVAFDGGTASGYDLVIGSGTFIDGFEDGVVGMEIGETRDINLTFPDTYSNNPDLAGKEVVFTVTVNGITVSETPELTDDYVQGLELEGCTTVEEYRSYMYDVLMEQEQASYEDEKINAAVEALEESSVFSQPPEGMVSRINESMLSNASAYASMYGLDIATYVSYVYGGTEEDYEEVLLEQATLLAQRYIMLAAMADKEGITVSEDELEETLAQEAESYGYDSVDDYKADVDTEAYREYLLVQKAIDFLGENAVAVGGTSE